MLRNQWDQKLLNQCEQITGHTLIRERQSLARANQDFGRFISGEAAAVFKAETISEAQDILHFAHHHRLPLTIRANGLSQAGQSLAPEGGIGLDISGINDEICWQGDRLIAGCSASWKSIVIKALENQCLPMVVPYNTDLTLGGVLSVGGLGSTTFKHGVIAAHVDELLVLTADGSLIRCNKQTHSDLFLSCLSGAGLFGIILEAAIKVRPCKQNVRVFTLIYKNHQQWLDDQFTLKQYGHYLEASIMDDPENPGDKCCIINLGLEYNDTPPELEMALLSDPMISCVDDLPILNYTYRHDSRLQGLKDSGAWAQAHPWYECYVDRNKLIIELDDIVSILDENIGGIYHIFPVAPNAPKFFMLPKTDQIVTFNVLTPGIDKTHSAKAIDALLTVNDRLMKLGGKRYISGWFNYPVRENFWLSHYGDLYQERKQIKLKYDPKQIFCSQLFPVC